MDELSEEQLREIGRAEMARLTNPPEATVADGVVTNITLTNGGPPFPYPYEFIAVPTPEGSEESE